MTEPDAVTFAGRFVARLRDGGLLVPADATAIYVAALAQLDAGSRSDAYWAGRATLVHRPQDVETYDRIFAAVFDGIVDGSVEPPGAPEEPPARDPVGVDDPDLRAAPDDEPGRPGTELRWSDRERLRSRDFATCTDDELDEIRRLVASIALTTAPRRTRRHRPARRRRGPLDLRATATSALRTGGEPVRTRHRAPTERPRRLVLLCDVSGSMEPYARELVRFAHAAVLARGAVEVFTLGTRCTRITRSLRTHDVDAALSAAAAAVPDWSGGTRLGEGLGAFNDTWGQRGMARGAVVVVLSDGWDRGEPEVLAEQTARLRRTAHRLIWVNPLKGSPDYAPTARGMAAALPHVDEFLEGHSLGSLDALAEVIAR